jgi:hypothetical protein
MTTEFEYENLFEMEMQNFLKSLWRVGSDFTQSMLLRLWPYYVQVFKLKMGPNL